MEQSDVPFRRNSFFRWNIFPPLRRTLPIQHYRPGPKKDKLIPAMLHLVEEDGTTIKMAPSGPRFDVSPLSFSDLAVMATASDPVVPLTINHIYASGLPDTETSVPSTVQARLAGTGPITVYGLVEGGWLPLPWAHKHIALLDRNMVISLERLHAHHEPSLEPDPAPWLNHLGLDSDEVSVIPFILEGPKQRPPTDFEMRVEASRIMKIIKARLPNTKLRALSQEQRQALRRYMLDGRESQTRASRLLQRAAPLVAQSVKATERIRLETKILDIAKAEQIPTCSLPVLALLSCIYDGKPGLPKHRVYRPGRAILKPRVEYGNCQSYNALADFSFIEFLFNIQAFMPEAPAVLYTQDIGLAAFWAALQPCRVTQNWLQHGRISTTINFECRQMLFPALNSDELLALRERLIGYP